MTAEVWTCDQELYQQVHDELAKSQLQLTKFEDGKFEGTVEAAEDGVLMLSLPYDEGWSVKIDGEDDDYYMIGDALTGVDVTEGTHTITFEYTPEGLWKGTWISLICVALYLLTSAIWIRKVKSRNFHLQVMRLKNMTLKNGQAEKKTRMRKMKQQKKPYLRIRRTQIQEIYKKEMERIMEFEFSKKADSFQAGNFAILNEKKEEMVKAGKKVYNLSVGTPDFKPAPHIMEAVSEAAKRSGKL